MLQMYGSRHGMPSTVHFTLIHCLQTVLQSPAQWIEDFLVYLLVLFSRHRLISLHNYAKEGSLLLHERCFLLGSDSTALLRAL